MFTKPKSYYQIYSSNDIIWIDAKRSFVSLVLLMLSPLLCICLIYIIYYVHGNDTAFMILYYIYMNLASIGKLSVFGFLITSISIDISKNSMDFWLSISDRIKLRLKRRNLPDLINIDYVYDKKGDKYEIELYDDNGNSIYKFIYMGEYDVDKLISLLSKYPNVTIDYYLKFV